MLKYQYPYQSYLRIIAFGGWRINKQIFGMIFTEVIKNLMTLEVPTVHEWRLLEGRRRLLSTNEVGSNQNKRSMEFPIEDKEKIRLWHSNIQVIVFRILRMDSKHINFFNFRTYSQQRLAIYLIRCTSMLEASSFGANVKNNENDNDSAQKEESPI